MPKSFAFVLRPFPSVIRDKYAFGIQLPLLFFISILFGCATPSNVKSPSWSELKLPGLIIELEDPKIEEWYFFSPHGAVSATLGEKGGAVCAPLFYWKINGEFLVITDYDKKLIQKFSLVEIRKNDIVIRRHAGTASALAIFKIKRQ